MAINLIRRAKLGYSSSEKIRRLARLLTDSKPYSYVLKKLVSFRKEKDKRGPFNLVIETSNICNACCLMCPYRIMKRPRIIMEEKIFNKITRRIKEENLPINKIFFSGMGEPLADPNLIKRVAVVKKMGLPVRLYTNASLLTRKTAQELVGIGLDEINISFNGTNSIEYQKIMGLDFKKTVSNIKNLIAARKKASASRPFIQISSIVIKQNRRNIKKHLDNWKDKVDSATVSLAHRWGGGVEINSEFVFQKKTYPCRSLWHTFVIDSSGNFVVCCRDYESRYILGNIMADSFSRIQKNPILKRFQDLHLKYDRKKLPEICQKCNFPYQAGIEWFLPRSID